MSTDDEDVEVIKQGWIQKQSRYLGNWRLRWMILTATTLCTYEKDKKLGKPTERITLTEMRSSISFDSVNNETESMFVINLPNRKMYFKCDSLLTKTQWLTSLYVSTTYINIPINVECLRNEKYNLNFDIPIPYYHEYGIDQLINDIMKDFNKKNDKLKFIAKTILSDSFIGQKINYADYDWKNCDVTINEFPKEYIIQTGVHLLVDFDIYKHNISSLNAPKCKLIKDYDDLCPIYAKMRYQDIFEEEYLSHLNSFSHFTDEMEEKPECKYKDECYAYKRLSEEGGNTLTDRCHIMIYKHPPRTRKITASKEINSFSFNDFFDENKPIYIPNNEDQKEYKCNDKDGYLSALIEEVINNKYKYDLCLECSINDECKHDNYSIMSIVNEKINCLRHQKMGSPLNKSEMLSIILYTGGECNYDLCGSQRNGNYMKWKWFDYCLYSAINKLCKREYGRYKIFTGLEKVKLDWIDCESGYFKTYVSTSFIKAIALEFVQQNGMLIEMDQQFRQNAICCDVSWISKFGLSECEILIARSIGAVFNNFKCKVVDHIINTQIQHVLLLPFGYKKNKIKMKQAIARVILPQEPLKSSQDTQNDKHGLLDEKKMASLHETMQKVSLTKKDIVFGFIKIIQKTLLSTSNYHYIPLEIFYIICILYEFEFKQIYTVGDGLEVTVNQNEIIIRNLSRSVQTAYLPYHNIGICKDHLVHVYVIEINSLSSKWIFGIDSSSQYHTKTNFTTRSNKQCFYAMDSQAKFHKNNKDLNAKYVTLKKNVENKTIKIEFLAYRGVLIFIENNETIGYFAGIDTSKRYHFAMSLFGKNDTIYFKKYYSKKALELVIDSNETYKSNGTIICSSILIKQNGVLTVDKWKNNGGRLIIFCEDVILEKGAKIDLNAKGYEGGNGYCSGYSYKGTSTETKRANFGGGGGALDDHYDKSDGGGGGGYGSAGERGGGVVGGGGIYGDKQLIELHLGSGGGGCWSRSVGGSGGGALKMKCFGNLVLSEEASICCKGGDGVVDGGFGNGGGGSGGSIHIIVNGKDNIKMSELSCISACGGNGWEYGGAGGVGRIRIEYMSNNNSASDQKWDIVPQPFIG